MIFNDEMFKYYLFVITSGMAAGFSIGFIAWAIGFGIYGIIKWIKLS